MKSAKVESETHQKWMTVAEAAKYVRLHPRTVRNYMSRGAIPFHRNKQTGTVRLRADELDAWLMDSGETS